MVLADLVTQELEKQGITVHAPIAGDKPVYAGRRSDGTQVILKATRPHPDQREQEIRQKIIENEFNMQSAIGNHPNICPAYKLFRIELPGDQVHYVLAVNFVDGKSLDMKQHEFYQDPDGDYHYFKALRGAAEAIRHLHTRNVVHLDIKPHNIMVDKEDGNGVLIDFGSAKKEDESYPGVLEGFALCTPEYAPHEQRWGNPSKQSDIYQLGATIFDGISCGGTFYDVTKGPDGLVSDVHYHSPKDLLDANPRLSTYKVLRNMLERARSNEPERRPSIDDMCATIRDHETYFRTHPLHKRLLPCTDQAVLKTASTVTGID